MSNYTNEEIWEMVWEELGSNSPVVEDLDKEIEVGIIDPIWENEGVML